jgi:apolipoprotein N-acyltransferase
VKIPIRRNDVFLSMATAALLSAAYPPVPAGPLSLIALVPFFFGIEGKRAVPAFRFGYATALVWNLATLYWIAWPTIPGFIGAMVILPLGMAVFSGGMAHLLRSFGWKAWVFAPFLWSATEILSALGPFAFPWNSLAVTLTGIPAWIQHAALAGAPGVSFWIVSVNGLAFAAFRMLSRPRAAASLAAGAAVLALLPLAVGSRMPAGDASGAAVRVSLAQGNIDPYKKWTPSFIDSNFIVYDRLTREAKRSVPDLVIWPETATPCYLRQRFVYLNWVKFLADSVSAPILTGSPDFEWAGDTLRSFNAAFLIRPRVWTLDRYCKMKLVPFSERAPFADVIPAIGKLAMHVSEDIGDYSPGDSVSVFSFIPRGTGRAARFGVLICFESVFPDLVREFVAKGAEFLVIITNDGWFGDTSGPRQHAAIAVLRAVENRRWIARCANTGISEFIDPFGRVILSTDLNREVLLNGVIRARRDKTPFAVWFPWFQRLMLVTAGGALVAGAVAGRRVHGRAKAKRTAK